MGGGLITFAQNKELGEGGSEELNLACGTFFIFAGVYIYPITWRFCLQLQMREDASTSMVRILVYERIRNREEEQ